MTRADTRPRTSPIRELGFWVTLMLGGLVWVAAIFWMLLHTITGPR